MSLEAALMSLTPFALEDALLSLAPYRLGSLSQSLRGWEVVLWSGQIGYSTYAATHGDSPSQALALAIAILDSGEGKTLDCNEPTCTSAQLNLLFPPSVGDFKRRSL